MKAGQNVSVGKSVWPSILGSNLIRILLKIDDATERRHIWSIGKQSLLGVLRRLVIYYSMASYIRNHPPKSNKSFIFLLYFVVRIDFSSLAPTALLK